MHPLVGDDDDALKNGNNDDDNNDGNDGHGNRSDGNAIGTMVTIINIPFSNNVVEPGEKFLGPSLGSHG